MKVRATRTHFDGLKLRERGEVFEISLAPTDALPNWVELADETTPSGDSSSASPAATRRADSRPVESSTTTRTAWSAADDADRAVTQLSEALNALRDVRRGVSAPAFAAGGARDVDGIPETLGAGAHRAESIGHIIGGEIIELEIARRMKAAGLDILFNAAARAGGIDQLSPLESLAQVWQARCATSLAPFFAR